MHFLLHCFHFFLLKRFFERSWWRRLAALRQHQSPPHERHTVPSPSLPSARSPLAPSFVGALGEHVLEAEAGVHSPDEGGAFAREVGPEVTTDHPEAGGAELEVHHPFHALDDAASAIALDVETDLAPTHGQAGAEPRGRVHREVPAHPVAEVVGPEHDAGTVSAEPELAARPAADAESDLRTDQAQLRGVEPGQAHESGDLRGAAVAAVAAVGTGGTLQSDGALDQHGRGHDGRLGVLERLDAALVVVEGPVDRGDLGVDRRELDFELLVTDHTAGRQGLQLGHPPPEVLDRELGLGGTRARLLGGRGGRRGVGADLAAGGLEGVELPLGCGDLGRLLGGPLLVTHLQRLAGEAHARGRSRGVGGGGDEREEGQEGREHRRFSFRHFGRRGRNCF